MLWVALAGAAIVAAYFLRALRPTQTPSPPDAGPAYVDSAVCAGCHQQIAKSYRATGMGRSFYRPRPESTVEDYQRHNTFYNRASDRYYTMLLRDGKFYQRRHQLGPDGKETNVIEKAVDFVVGSGNHARTYMSRTADGELVQLAVSWYAEKGGYWAMSPGYDRADQQDFRRLISHDDECLFCHNGYPRPEPGSPLPEGVDCQRCHGPGGAHIAAAGSGRATPESIRRAIVNPARLSRDRQLEVCMQCHLETTSRQLPNSIRRHDRALFSYRPGEPLGDYTIYFDHAPGTGHDDKFEIAHAAYRLRKSACFRASQMTCLTCHDPHQASGGAGSYTAVCRGCHATIVAPDHSPQAVAAAGGCVECHMPKRRAEDVVHVVMTDHYIQRRKPPGDLLAALPEVHDAGKNTYRGEVALYYPPQLPPAPENELYLALAQVQQAANLQSGIPRLRQAIEKQHPLKPEFYFELGKAYIKARDQDQAIHFLDEALRRQPGFVPAIKEMAAALIAANLLPRAADLLEKALARTPADAVLLTNLGNVYLQQGKLDRAVQTLDQASRVNPDLPDAYNLSGLARLQQRDRAAAEKGFREAIRIQPDLAIAHNNLANLLAGAGDYAQAGYHFEKAIASDPAYTEAHHSYGLVLGLMQSYDKALAELREAVRLDPKLAPAHNALADVLAAKGLLENAAGEYRRAIELNPDLADAAFGLGGVLVALKQPGEAEQQFRRAIQLNPGYYEAHFALGQILNRTGRNAEARAHYEKAAESADPQLRQAARKALR
jgi:predicted CXXCH cytochrome family protein